MFACTAAISVSYAFLLTKAESMKLFWTLLLSTPFLLAGQTLCDMGDAAGYPCNNVDLMAHMPTSTFGTGIEFNDIWGWTDPLDGKEYALLGVTNGTAFVDISDPVNPVYLGALPTQTSNSLWRDIKVYNNYAFIVSEAGSHGMQVFDLTRLRNVPAPPETFTIDALYTGFGNCHNIVINPSVGLAYGVGSNTFSGGLHIVNISDPLNPMIAGDFSLDGYTHDAQVVTYNGPDAAYVGREIAFACNEDDVTIVDVDDPTDTQQISSTTYPGVAYCHQGWLSDDHQFFFSNDELDENNLGVNTTTFIWDVSDLDAPVLVGTYVSSEAAIDHNLYVDANLIYESNYRAGLRILDNTNAAAGALSEVAYFDVYPASNSAAFNGTWSNYPYFDSGIVVVSHIESGLFLLRPRFIDTNTATDLVCNTDDFVINIDLAVGFAGPINLAMDNLPAGFNATFSANDVAPGSYTVTITNPGELEGNFDFTVVATGAHFSYSSTQSVTTYDCASAVLGCTDPAADNYDPAATIDDGSCTYPCYDVTLDLLTDCWGNEVTWELADASGAIVASGGPYANQSTNIVNLCLSAGCYDFTILDSFGDGMSGSQYGSCGVDGNYVWTYDADGSVLIQMLVANYGNSETQQFCVPLTVDGCTDATACNYDPAATSDDGSCEFVSCAGCTDMGACNYDATATIDDGNCEFLSCVGCTDPTACNYDATATIDDMSCILPDGCTDMGACNYDAAATCDDGSCEYITCAGCLDPMACNYDATATIDDGSCEFLTCAGCTNMTACNYDATATIDDGSCILPDGCTDNTACNYDATALCDNGSCEYTSCAPCYGDLDGDGLRSVGDLLIVLGDFGCIAGAEPCPGDLTGDGQVNTSDVLDLVGVFGLPCP